MDSPKLPAGAGDNQPVATPSNRARRQLFGIALSDLALSAYLLGLVGLIVAAVTATEGDPAWSIALGLGGLALVTVWVIRFDLGSTVRSSDVEATAALAGREAVRRGTRPAGALAEAEGFAVWFTGLPSSGKSTLATLLSSRLAAQGTAVEVLEGDKLRRRSEWSLGFSKEDRNANVARLAYLASTVTRVGGVAVVCAVSPYRAARDAARAEIGRFVEVFVDCPLEECMRRDDQGHYQRALAGQIPNFTGVSDPYEAPQRPEVVVHTERQSPQECVDEIISKLVTLGYLSTPARQNVQVPIPAQLADRVAARVGTRDPAHLAGYVSDVVDRSLKAQPSTGGRAQGQTERRPTG